MTTIEVEEVFDLAQVEEWNCPRKALAIYALLKCAGLPDDSDMNNVVEIACAITGESTARMDFAIRAVASGIYRAEDAAYPVGFFDSMGLDKAAAELRRWNNGW